MVLAAIMGEEELERQTKSLFALVIFVGQTGLLA
jgi:hypothetical protein